MCEQNEVSSLKNLKKQWGINISRSESEVIFPPWKNRNSFPQMHLQSLVLLPTVCPVCAGDHTPPRCCVIWHQASGSAVLGGYFQELCVHKRVHVDLSLLFKAVSIHLHSSTRCSENSASQSSWWEKKIEMVVQAETFTWKPHNSLFKAWSRVLVDSRGK